MLNSELESTAAPVLILLGFRISDGVSSLFWSTDCYRAQIFDSKFSVKILVLSPRDPLVLEPAAADFR